MKHWQVLMNETTTYTDIRTNKRIVNKSPIYVVIRAKNQPNVNAWIKRNNREWNTNTTHGTCTYEFVKIVDYGFTDRKAMNL